VYGGAAIFSEAVFGGIQATQSVKCTDSRRETGNRYVKKNGGVWLI